MPLLRYFLGVGASLIALLFAANAYLPAPAERADIAHTANIRIASERKGPEAVTFSGQSVRYGPAPEMRVVDFTDPAALASATPAPAPANEAFAQVRETSAVEEAPKLKKVAKRKPRPRPAPEYDAFAARPAHVWPGQRMAGTLFGW